MTNHRVEVMSDILKRTFKINCLIKVWFVNTNNRLYKNMSDHLGWVGGLEEGRSHFSWVSGNPMFTDSVFVKGDCEARMSGSTERTMHFICYYCTTYYTCWTAISSCFNRLVGIQIKF